MSETFSKSYRLSKSDYEGAEVYWQERQTNDVRQSAITQGYRPVGDVEFSHAEDLGSTVNLFFTLPVVLAADADGYEVIHARVSEKAQAVLADAVASGQDIDEADREAAAKGDLVEPSSGDAAEAGVLTKAPKAAKVKASKEKVAPVERQGPGGPDPEEANKVQADLKHPDEDLATGLPKDDKEPS
jgi:hypothetical protein